MSGSGFLSSILTSTGVLGVPREYFNTRAMRERDATYPDEPQAQLAAIAKAATANGVYGLVIFGLQFAQLNGLRWAETLPSLGFVSLTRLDVLDQAISLVRAAPAGGAHASEEPAYDFAKIDAAVLAILTAQNRWANYFTRNNVRVLHLFHEQILQFPQQTAEAVAHFVGVAETPRVRMDALATPPQRDPANWAWRERFVADGGDLGQFHNLTHSPPASPPAGFG
jgi:LPS sulfotransferase NodH